MIRKNQAAADRYYHQLHLKPWAKSPEEAAWALMQRIMGLVGEHHGSALQVAVSHLHWPRPIKFATILLVALPVMRCQLIKLANWYYSAMRREAEEAGL